MVVMGRRARPRRDLKARPHRVEGYFSHTPTPVTGSGSPLHVNAAIGPGLRKHAKSPLHAPVPMAPSTPADPHALTPLQDSALTFPLLLLQAKGPRQLFLAMAPWFAAQAAKSTQLFSPTLPSLPPHAETPR